MLPALLPDQRVRQRDYLLEIIRALTEQLDLETVLERILRAALDLLTGRAGLIALHEDDGLLHVHTRAGFSAAQAVLVDATENRAAAAATLSSWSSPCSKRRRRCACRRALEPIRSSATTHCCA